MSEQIPIVEVYRGVGIHTEQPRERIEAIVKPQIDEVIAASDAARLYELAGTLHLCPEARLLASAKLETIIAIATERRETRPSFSVEEVRALVAGLDSVRTRSRTHFTQIFERRPAPGERGPDRREQRLGGDDAKR
ncbi:MAG: hypothetical protein WAW96_20590 [Alphaproteobacteria bacterium]